MIRHLLRVSAALAAILVLMAGFGPAFAFVAPDGTDDLSIPIPENDEALANSAIARLEGGRAAAAFSTAAGGTWRIWSWNARTGTPHAMYGSGLPSRAPFGGRDEAVAAARELVQSHPELIGTGVENLRVAGCETGYGKTSVHFQQTYSGIDVHGAVVRLLYTDEGRLSFLGSDAHRRISLDPKPSIPSSVAGELAARDLAPWAGRLDPAEAALLVLPVPRGESGFEYHLVWRVKVWTDEPVGLWATFVDAHSGAIIWRYNEACFVDFTGDSSGLIQPSTYCNGQEPQTMPFTRVSVDGAGAVYTDANGDWTVGYAGSDPKTVTADLYGPYCDINNVSGGPQGAFTGLATPGVPLTVAFTNLNSQRDEKDVFRAVNDVHLFYQDIDPTYHYINEVMPATVSIASTCNAYYVGHTINFYQAGGGCANTGEIQGVVHHEFGHGITEEILGNQGTQGIGEGNSDILANYMTGESIIGRGFYEGVCTSGIRNSENTLQYPEDLNGQIHHDGQIIAGFHWDSWQELQASLPAEEARLLAINTWHWGRIHQHPTTQPDQVLAIFLADDDDGNLLNGTPHYAAFCAGAMNHGFPCPEVINGVAFEHEGLVSRTEAGDAAVVATVYSTEGTIVADSTQIRYRVNGGPFTRVAMAPTGNPNEYAGTIPGLQSGDEIEYFLRAEDEDGNIGSSPSGAPLDTWAFDIATIVDHLEEDSGWMINAEGTDNATSGQWNLVDPNGTSLNGQPVQPEDDRTPTPGVQCWVTGQGSVGGAPGEMDVDNGRTSLYTPVYDLAGSSVAVLKYWRWYTNDLGSYPGQDTWLVQARNNEGPWVDLENTNESANWWSIREFDLAALFGAELGLVQVKFVASDVVPHSTVEAAVDEFEILSIAPQAVPEWTSGPARFALLGGRPNPVTRGAEIGFALPATARVRLALFDVSGRQVLSLADGEFGPGLQTLAWDGADAEGRPVASGTYYVRMQSGGFTSTRSLVVTR